MKTDAGRDMSQPNPDALTVAARIMFTSRLRSLNMLTEDSVAAQWEALAADPDRLKVAHESVRDLVRELRGVLAADVTAVRDALEASAVEWRRHPAEFDRGHASGLEQACQQLSVLLEGPGALLKAP